MLINSSSVKFPAKTILFKWSYFLIDFINSLDSVPENTSFKSGYDFELQKDSITLFWFLWAFRLPTHNAYLKAYFVSTSTGSSKNLVSTPQPTQETFNLSTPDQSIIRFLENSEIVKIWAALRIALFRKKL